MNSLFDTAGSKEMIERINRLTADAKGEWGKMRVDQMLAHVTVSFKVACGELKLKRGLLGILFGNLAKRQIMSDKPFSKNSPTDKHYIVTDRRNFDEERKSLAASVERFSKAGPAGTTKEPHPFFGVLNSHEWDRLMWKHLDHHLRQFGA